MGTYARFRVIRRLDSRRADIWKTLARRLYNQWRAVYPQLRYDPIGGMFYEIADDSEFIASMKKRYPDFQPNGEFYEKPTKLPIFPHPPTPDRLEIRAHDSHWLSERDRVVVGILVLAKAIYQDDMFLEVDFLTTVQEYSPALRLMSPISIRVTEVELINDSVWYGAPKVLLDLRETGSRLTSNIIRNNIGDITARLYHPVRNLRPGQGVMGRMYQSDARAMGVSEQVLQDELAGVPRYSNRIANAASRRLAGTPYTRNIG